MWRDQKAIERLEDRCKRLEMLCDDLDRAYKKLNLEFTELYDKVAHQMSRMAKRDARANKELQPNGEEPAGESPLEQIDPISKSIMLRRGMGALRK